MNAKVADSLSSVERNATDSDSLLNFLSLIEVPHIVRSWLHIGKSSEAVKLLSEALVEFTKKYPHMLSDAFIEWDSHKIGPASWPRLGANFSINAHRQAVIEFSKTEFNVAEATTYLEFYSRLIDGARVYTRANLREKLGWKQRISLKLRSWRRSARGKMIVVIHKLVHKALPMVPAGLNPSNKWRCVALLKKVERMVAGSRSSKLSSRAICVAKCLHEPIETAEKLLAKSEIFQIFKKMEEKQARKFNEEEKLNRFVWSEENEYKEFFREQKPARILTTIHLGPITHALMYVAKHNTKGSEILSLAQWETDIETKHRYIDRFEEMGLRYRQIGGDQHDAIQTIAALRRGNTSLTIYYDLSTTYGETVEVEFFGRTAQFVRGPAELAIIGKAPIYPMYSFFDGGTPRIEMHDPIDPKLKAGESVEQAVKRITQQLASLAEIYIRKYPEQWRFLPNLESYFLGRGAYVRR